MSNELVQTRFDYGLLDEETRIFVKVKAQAIQARLKRTAEDIIEIGKDLIAVQERLRGDNEGQGYRGENQGNGQFHAWIKTEFEMSRRTAFNFMAVADKFGEKSATVALFSPKVLYELATASDDIVEKVESGQMEAEAKEKEISLLEAIQLEKRAERAEKKAKELEEENKKIQGKLNLFEEDRDKERKGLNNKIQAKENEILAYKQKEAARQEQLRSEAKQQLEKDLAKQRQEQKAELKKLEKELKEEYQFKAENTIRGLLSNGAKRMAEAQMTLDHTVSDAVLQAVLQLGGKQLDSYLAQVISLRESLDRVEAKLTQGNYIQEDYIALPERIIVNG